MSELLAKAITFASGAHEGQTDKQGVPYILHPLRVMFAVRKACYAEKYQVVAVLHDVVEDTPITLPDILNEFGGEIHDAVDAISRRKVSPNLEPGTTTFGHTNSIGKELHWEYFLRCIKNPIARVVKYYDTLDNVDPKRFTYAAPYGRYHKMLDFYKKHGIDGDG